MTARGLAWRGDVPAPRGAWVTVRRWLLPVSLAANVFLLAHAAAPMLHPNHRPGFPGMVDHFARNLPSDDALRFRAVLERERPAFEATRRDMDRSRAALSRSIAADPYDPADVRARMSDWQAHLHAMSDRFGDTLLLAMPLLTPEGRARLADAAEHPPPPGPPPPDEPSPGPPRGSRQP